MAGFGRTGKWFAVDHWGVEPDILTGAKGINSGYVPLGTMSVSNELAEWLKDYPAARRPDLCRPSTRLRQRHRGDPGDGRGGRARPCHAYGTT